MVKSGDIIEEVRRYCDATGIAPSTLALRAVNNARFLERLERRLRVEAAAVARIRAYMRENPPPSSPSSTEADAA